MEYTGFLTRELAEQFAATCKGKVEDYKLKVQGHGVIDCFRVVTDERDERMEVLSVRMPYSLYLRARNRAELDGTYTSDVIRRAVEAYTATDQSGK